MPSFWKLPGPSRFIETIQNAINAGKNVLVLFPEHSPSHFLKVIKEPLSESSELAWSQFHSEEFTEEKSPTHFLIDKFVAQFPKNTLRNCANLCQQSQFQSRLICIDFFSEHAWQAWKKFLKEYEPACQEQPLLQRTLFLILLNGSLAINPPPANEYLIPCCWDGFIDEIDMMVYSSSHLQSKEAPSLHNRLKISILTQLSLWDPKLCLRLLKEPLQQLCEPSSMLKDFAQKRGWDQEIGNEDKNKLWYLGCLQKIEGQEQYHSAYLAQINADDEIKRRIWRAQIQVLFPYLEEQRQKFLKLLGPFLEVPNDINTPLKDLRDLEFSHIVYQIKDKNISVPPKIWKSLNLLKKIRDCLAHFELAPTELLLDSNLFLDV